MGRYRPKIGDIFAIPLPNGRKAFGQYVHKDIKYWQIARIFNYFSTSENISPDILVTKDLLFPPVFLNIYRAINHHNWKVIGNVSINNFIYVPFLSTLEDIQTGKASTWYMWDGEKTTRIGNTLSDEQKKFDMLALHPVSEIIERIMTGKRFQDELINNNKQPVSLQISKEEKEILWKELHSK